MFKYQHIVTTPLFFLFIGFSCLLSIVFYWGRRENKKVFLEAFNDLVDVIRPDKQIFTNIGGLVGYHANLAINKKDRPFSKVDATITLLPRHSLLYMPVSLMIMRFDRLFITLYQRASFSGEGHLIEKQYAGFRGPKITHANRMEKVEIKWGAYDFLLYFEQLKVRDQFLSLVRRMPDPGVLRHVAIVADQRKCFIFMIPKKGKVKTNLSPVYEWLCSISK